MIKYFLQYPTTWLLTAILFFTIHTTAQNVDINTLKSINGNASNFKTNYSDFASSSVAIVSVGTPLCLYATGLLQHNSKLKKDALYMAGSYVVGAAYTQLVKRIVNRNRPFVTYSFIEKRDNESGEYSFPSAHTSAAFTTATALALRYKKWYIVAPAYAWATSVGWARMYQGVHYPSDVLGGVVIGAASGWLGYKLQKIIEKKQAHK